MTKNTDEFLKEGISRYKQATLVYFTFRKELQNKLQSILRNHKDWGILVPDFKTIRSTTYGQDYPGLNARISFKKSEEILIMTIVVNWFMSDNDFPLFEVFLENENNHTTKFGHISWNHPYELNDRSLRFYPDPKNYDLEKDFHELISEFLRGLSNPIV
jgi:hypothetical protein